MSKEGSAGQLHNANNDDLNDRADPAEPHVPSRFSQLLSTNHRELGHTAAEVHRMSSPVRRNRPRITNEVQSSDKDIAQIVQKMQQQH